MIFKHFILLLIENMFYTVIFYTIYKEEGILF